MNLKRITEILPLFGILLVILGYLKLYLYYDHWHIPIIDYLDISEITLLFLSDVHIIFAFVGIYIFPVTIGLAIVRYAEDREKRSQVETGTISEGTAVAEPSTNISDATKSTGLSHEESTFRRIMMIGCFIVAAVFIFFFFKYNKIWLLYCSTLGFMQFALFFCEYVFHDNGKLSEQITFVTSATAFSILVAHYDICKTESNPDNLETSIVTEARTFTTSNELLYVGKTNNFIFLYNVPIKSSQVIKTTEMKEVLVKEISTSK